MSTKRKDLPSIVPEAVWIEIGQRYESGQSTKSILAMYGVAESTFHWHKKRRGWKRKGLNTVSKIVAEAAINPTGSNINKAVKALEDRARMDVPAIHGSSGGLVTAVDDRPHLPFESKRMLDLVNVMISKLQMILASQELTDDDKPLRDRTRSYLDLTSALERLQKIERTALGLDQGTAHVGGTVVIVVPQKQSEEEWSRNAKQIKPVSVEDSE